MWFCRNPECLSHSFHQLCLQLSRTILLFTAWPKVICILVASFLWLPLDWAIRITLRLWILGQEGKLLILSKNKDPVPLFVVWTRGSWWSLWDYLPCRLSSGLGSYSSLCKHCPVSQGATVMPQVWWGLWTQVLALWPHPTEKISWGFGPSASMIPFTGENDWNWLSQRRERLREKRYQNFSNITSLIWKKDGVDVEFIQERKVKNSFTKQILSTDLNI